MYEAEATADMLLMTGQSTPTMAAEAPSSPEALLIKAVLDGNRDSFGRLYELYAPMVHGILLARVPRTEVEDLVQDIFLHAFKKLTTLRDANAFGETAAGRDSRQPANTSSPEPTFATVRTPDKDRGELAVQRNSASRRNRATRNSDRNDSLLLRDKMTAARRAEAEAAKDQLMLALRAVSAKLNLAQRRIPATNMIRNQHKLG